MFRSKNAWRMRLDPRDPDYDGPDDDDEIEEEDGYEDFEPDDFYVDDAAADYIMTEPELRGQL